MLNVGVLAKFSNESKQRLSETQDCCFTFLDGTAEDNAIKDFAVVIGEPSQAQLENAPNLKLLQLTWAGADKYCGAGDFLLANASGAFGRPISEYVVGAILCLYKRFPQYLEHKHNRLWLDAGAERSLSGKTVLILGTGDIGQSIAKRLCAFDAKILGIRRRPQRTEGFKRVYSLDSLDILLKDADIVIGCLPNTPQTAGLLCKKRLLEMKKDALLVNVGRGSLISSADLAEVLKGGHLSGAVLDVFDREPLDNDSPLWDMDNLFITPHISGIGLGHDEQTERDVVDICIKNLTSLANGRPLINLVDKTLGY
ncbi:MAG: D-2-hydroxyacid dehydrogenase [Clostridia bacterium]|nr:D-2-hydroxyacid dehydrogenase [Clostridia bacterium]